MKRVILNECFKLTQNEGAKLEEKGNEILLFTRGLLSNIPATLTLKNIKKKNLNLSLALNTFEENTEIYVSLTNDKKIVQLSNLKKSIEFNLNQIDTITFFIPNVTKKTSKFTLSFNIT